MKKTLLILVVLLAFLSGFSFGPWTTPAPGVLEEGRLTADIFYPGWGGRFGIIGIVEVGYSVNERGAYIKFGSDKIQNIPLAFNVGYSRNYLLTDSGGYNTQTGTLFSTIDLNLEKFKFGGGVLYTETLKELNNQKIFVGTGFLRTNFFIEKIDNKIKSFSLEGGLNVDDKFKVISYFGSFFANERFELAKFKKPEYLIWFDYIDLVAGLYISNDITTMLDMINDVQIIIGISTSWKLF